MEPENNIEDSFDWFSHMDMLAQSCQQQVEGGYTVAVKSETGISFS